MVATVRVASVVGDRPRVVVTAVGRVRAASGGGDRGRGSVVATVRRVATGGGDRCGWPPVAATAVATVVATVRVASGWRSPRGWFPWR